MQLHNRDDNKNRSFEYGLWLLGRRPYTQKNLREKLEGKKFESDEVDAAISRLLELGFLDDLEFAKNYIRQSTLGKPKGGRRIRFELMRKGVDKELIEQAIEEANLHDAEPELIMLALKNYLKKLHNLPREKIYARAMGFLMRRGFPYNESKKAISTYLDEGRFL